MFGYSLTHQVVSILIKSISFVLCLQIKAFRLYERDRRPVEQLGDEDKFMLQVGPSSCPRKHAGSSPEAFCLLRVKAVVASVQPELRRIISA